jgi:FAD/FMN-containing dehydrogenase
MVQPDNAQDIAIALGVVRKFGCHFAVLGGGTSPFKGASNAHGGVTIDLYALNTVKFTSSEKKHARVGGGAIWADVYRYLDPKNMSAVGTRNSLTGVAGSIIGGRNVSSHVAGCYLQYYRWHLVLLASTWLVLRLSHRIRSHPRK